VEEDLDVSVIGHDRRSDTTLTKVGKFLGRLAFAVTLCMTPMQLAIGPAGAQAGVPAGEWWSYGADLGSTRYAPLDQINKDNFSKLQIAWRFKTDSLGPRPEFNFQSTPLMVNGIVYTTAGSRRAAVALDAATGEMLWMHSENEGKRGDAAPRKLSGHGVSYWTDGRESRIYYVTPGYRLIALDAKTGELVRSFGANGVVDLKQDDDQEMDLVTGEIGLHSTPIIAKDVIVVGAAHLAGQAPKVQNNQKGYVRGFDVRTGKRLWIFHTIPQPGETGNDTWLKDSWARTGNTGVWAQMSADEELGLVYLPVELPTGDYYGGHRPGNTLFGESLVALEIKTGKRRWHYQFVHHGIWDMDLPAAPILCDVVVSGRAIKAIAQPTKQAWLYVFDRATGVPIWPIEERPVPKGDVPTEWYAPTQPFVTKPPPYDRQGVSVDDLIDFTPELRAEAQKLMARYKSGPLFTPPVVSVWPAPLGTLFLPSILGGTNWPGASFEPDTKLFYVYSITQASPIGLVPAEGRSELPYVVGVARDPAAAAAGGRGGRGGGEGGGGGESAVSLSVDGLPLIKPPYARITAIDLNKGEIAWQVAHGETPDNIKNHPKLKGLSIPRTGRIGRIGTLSTKTLVIAGEAGLINTPQGRGAYLRAYDKMTGADAGTVYMPAGETGSPMSYLWQGKQFVLIAIGGANYSAELLAFKLPD
jgi:quinoprotein glucose dehydrogenase